MTLSLRLCSVGDVWACRTDREIKTEVLREKPVPVPLFSPQILHGLDWDWIRASGMRGRRLPAEPWHGPAMICCKINGSPCSPKKVWHNENGGVAVRILNFVTQWKWMVCFTARLLHLPPKTCRYRFYSRLVWSQYSFGCFWEGRNLSLADN